MDRDLSGDRIAGIIASIEMETGGIDLAAPGTTDTFDNPIINPMERYSADSPELFRTRGEEFVLFGYDDTDDYRYTNTREVLRDIFRGERIEGQRVDIASHTKHPPTFKYGSALPPYRTVLNRSTDPDASDTRLNHAACWGCMRPDGFLRAQAPMFDTDVEGFVEPRVREREDGRTNITALERGLRSSEPVVPAPPMEFDTNGELLYQEGRTRAFIARELGIEWINVLFLVNKKKGDGEGV